MEPFDNIEKIPSKSDRLFSSSDGGLEEDDVNEGKFMKYDYRLSIDECDCSVDLTIERETKKRFTLPFIIYVLIFAVILLISSLISLLIVYLEYKQNYTFEQNIYLKPSVSGHRYARLKFPNHLEIVLTQVHSDDMAGGAISLDSGYLDKNFLPGFVKYAFLCMRNNDFNQIQQLQDYMGSLTQVSEEFYSSTYFTILNSGFHNYLKNFQDYSNSKTNFSNFANWRLLRDYTLAKRSVKEKEKFLIEYLVYDIKDENGTDIWRQGIFDEIREYINGNFSDILEVMSYLLDPGRVKFIFFSHYKMSLMRKYILRDFKKMINVESNINYNDDKDKDDINHQYDHLNTNKIIFHQIENNETNYIKINYYINNTNASLSQLYIDSGYFNYIKYILAETNEDSLYYNLTQTPGINIKSLTTDFEIVLKSRIKFSISILLNHHSYNHIDKIIAIVYEYMEKIKNHIYNMQPDDERAEELYKIVNQNFTFTEDIHEGEFYKNKAKDLFYKDIYDYYLKEVWIPPNLSKNSTDIKYYVGELIPENSVVIIGLNEKKIKKYNLTADPNINFIFNNIENTLHFNLNYSVNNLSRLINKNNDNATNNNKNILKYYKNNYISKYNESSILKNEEINVNKYQLIDNFDGVLKVFWLKNTRYNIPKVYINFYFFHPYLRPNDTSTIKDQYFFVSILFISYLERKINLTLADAKRAGNYFIINYAENYIYLDIFAYSDIVYEILNEIKNIFNSNIEEDIKNDYETYRDYALENLVNFGIDTNEMLKYKFYRKITSGSILPPIFDLYGFNSKNFENSWNNFQNSTSDMISYIRPPMTYFFILGYYEENEAKSISNLLHNFNKSSFIDSIDKTYNNDEIMNLNPDEFVKQILIRHELKNNISEKTELIEFNQGCSFMTFSNYSISNRMIVEILKKSTLFFNGTRNFFVRIESINQKDIYLKLNFPLKNFSNTNDVIEYLIDTVNRNEYNMMEYIDVVGGRYYYLIKNMDNEYNKNPLNMKQCALSYSFRQLYSIFEAESYYLNNNDYKGFTETIEKLLKKKSFYEFYNK